MKEKIIPSSGSELTDRSKSFGERERRRLDASVQNLQIPVQQTYLYPVSGQETQIDREDILDDLDIQTDDEEENGDSKS